MGESMTKPFFTKLISLLLTEAMLCSNIPSAWANSMESLRPRPALSAREIIGAVKRDTARDGGAAHGVSDLMKEVGGDLEFLGQEERSAQEKGVREAVARVIAAFENFLDSPRNVEAFKEHFGSGSGLILFMALNALEMGVADDPEGLAVAANEILEILRKAAPAEGTLVLKKESPAPWRPI